MPSNDDILDPALNCEDKYDENVLEGETPH
jgi:hypothetical protein